MGYWVYDVAVALEHCRKQDGFPRYRDALLRSYCAVRDMPDAQMQYLDLFMAALDVHIGLWANAVACLHPDNDGVGKRAERCLRLVKAHLAGLGS